MNRTLWTGLRAGALTLLVTGLLYPLLVTLLARGLFPRAAAGSLVAGERGAVIGSELIAQRFEGAGYFWPRPSAAGERGYDPRASSGSNLAPSARRLRERAAAELERLRAAQPEAPGPVPAELVLASASGLDPHLSPAAAAWQVGRVARARHLDPARVAAVLDSMVEGRDLGLLGEPRVNVLLLDLALDKQFGKPSGTATVP